MRRSRGLRIVFVNAVVFVGLIIVIEAAVRFLTPGIQPVGTDDELIKSGVFGDTAGPRPGASGTSNGVLRHVDDRGFWKYSAARPRKSGWLFLGDSATMGLGVPGDSTFAGLLAAAQDSLDVFNTSLPGHASDDYVAIFRSLVDETDIERVTVFWCLNDVMAGRSVSTAPAGARVLDNRIMAFVRRNVLTYSWAKATFTDRPKLYFLHDKQLYDSDRGYLDAAVSHVREIQQLAVREGIPMNVILLPYEYSLRTGDNHPRKVMKAELQRLGVAVLDAAEELGDISEPSRLYLYGDGIHFSNRGHREIARLLVHYFQDL